MELSELKNKWNNQNELVNKNIDINRSALKRLLKQSQTARFKRIKIEAVFNLVLPLIVIIGILIPKLIIRYDFRFLIGSVMFGLFFILTYYWAIKYAMLVFSIDFSNTILAIKKEVVELEKYKLKITRMGFTLAPIGIAGVFIMMGFPVFSKNSILPISIVVIVMIISIVVNFKYSIPQRFKTLNAEISELENLEVK